MATPLFQSWESLIEARLPREIPLDWLRIRWKAFDDPTGGGLASSIHVAAHARDPPSENDEPFSSSHPIATMPLTYPPISSITVTIDDVDTHQENWVCEHIPHWDIAVWEDVDDPTMADLGGEDDEIDDEEDQGNPRRLMRCCDEDRPPAPAPLTIRASDSTKGVTIHDYVVAVHSYLQAHRREILDARIALWCKEKEHELYVDPMSPGPNMIQFEDGQIGTDARSIWWRLRSYVDRKLAGELPSREEIQRSRQPMDPEQEREWLAAHPDAWAAFDRSMNMHMNMLDRLTEWRRQNRE